MGKILLEHVLQDNVRNVQTGAAGVQVSTVGTCCDSVEQKAQEKEEDVNTKCQICHG